MRISNSPSGSVPLRSAASPAPAPPPPPPPDPQDQVQIRAAHKKAWRQVEWATFGGQMVGGALVLSHQGPIGLAIFAASSAGMVYAGYKGQHS